MRFPGTSITPWLVVVCATIGARAAVQADPEMRSIPVLISRYKSIQHIVLTMSVAPHTQPCTCTLCPTPESDHRLSMLARDYA